ncbi:ankyrin repeat-containing domain protein [Lactarius vividus]|nr:ankyrin repeat-containing domain protein [Lactarius vividus]
MRSLFDPDKPHFTAWVRTYDLDPRSDGKSQSAEMPNPLYYSALCGFPDLARHLATKYPQYVNATGGFYEFPLVAALCRKHFGVAEVLLEHGGTVDARGRGKNTVLHKIIRLNEETIDAMRFLLGRGADVNARREDLWTPLHLAVEIGELEVARILLEHHADVNSQSNEGLTPLHLLSRQEMSPREDSDSTLARLLLENGANVNIRAKDNATPLHLASYNKKLETVRVLLDHGANADAENDEGRRPLQEVFRGINSSPEDGIALAQLLLERGAEAYARDKYHVTASELAFCFGEQKIWHHWQVLLGNHGAKFSLVIDRNRAAFHLWLKGNENARDKYDTILLHSACYYGRLEMAQVLLDHDIKVNAKNHWGDTALHVVSRGEHDSQDGVGVAQLLLERGGDVNTENNDHKTPLDTASYFGRFDIVQVLLDHDAKANAEDSSLRTPLHQVSCGEYDSKESGARIAQLLLDHGVDVNASDKYLWTPLQLASFKGRPGIVQVLLDHGAKADTKNDQDETPLHVMSRGKFDSQDGARVAQLLLDRGADVNARQKDRCTPLHEISRFGRLDIARVLIHHGAKANAEDSFLRTPLHAVSIGEYESQEDGARIAQLLLEHGVDVNARDRGRETPLHLASACEKLEIVRVLLDHATVKNDQGQTPSHQGSEEHGVDVNAHRGDLWTPLHIASFYGRLEIARTLLDHGAKANVENNLLKTPLHYVVEGNYESQEDGVRIARLLLEHGADVNALDIYHGTPLHSASSSGKLEIARTLLERAGMKNDRGQNLSHLGLEERGVDVNAHRKDHWTPLHLASHCGNPEVARMLIDHGANVNAEDNNLRTPLHHVVEGHYESQEVGVRLSRLLLECGVDVNAQDINRQTPLHLASINGRLEIVRVLLEHAAMKNDRGQNSSRRGLEERGVEVNARRMDDWTPLHLASYHGRLEIVRVLLDHGASANAENNQGETPLYLVSRGAYDSQDDGVYVAQLLLERGGNANAQRKDNWTPLHAASYFGRPGIVRILLDHGAEANAENRQSKNSLDQVSRGEYGSQEDGARVAQLLLDRGVDMNASDKDHWTPLHSASYYGRSEIVRVLLDHGANVNVENHEGETPLELVSRGKYNSEGDGVRVAQLLLDRGADVKAQPKGHWTPLNWASYYGRPDIVRLLVDHGATVNLNAEKSLLRTPLHDVSRGEYKSQDDGARVAQILLERGADVNAQDINRETPLHFASVSGRLEVARVLLNHGAIAKTVTYDSETPLHAISRGNYDTHDSACLAQLLLEHGVNANALDKDQDTPLHYACLFGKPDIARELLDHGAIATAENGQGETPLHVVSQGEHEPQDDVRLARLLLEHGADVNASNTNEDTPLHSACYNGRLDVARLLLNHGAAAHAQNNLGESPLHVISRGNPLSEDSVRIARLLLEHGVGVNTQDKVHRTPLHAASLRGSIEIAQVLLDHGATANAKDDFDWTPLLLLSRYGGDSEERSTSVARLLLEHGADIHALDMNLLTPLDHSSHRGWHKMAQVLLGHETKGKVA